MVAKNNNKASKARSGVNKKKSAISKSKLKFKSKSARNSIDKLNSNVREINEIKQLLGSSDTTSKQKILNVLDAKKLKEDLKKDEEIKANNKAVENDINKQLELLTGMGL